MKLKIPLLVGTALTLVFAAIQLIIGFTTDYHWANLIHFGIFLTMFLLVIYCASYIIMWAIFPYSNKLVGHLHT